MESSLSARSLSCLTVSTNSVTSCSAHMQTLVFAGFLLFVGARGESTPVDFMFALCFVVSWTKNKSERFRYKDGKAKKLEHTDVYRCRVRLHLNAFSTSQISSLCTYPWFCAVNSISGMIICCTLIQCQSKSWHWVKIFVLWWWLCTCIQRLHITAF